MGIKEESLELHEKLKGKIEVVSKVHVKERKDLSLLYTPGVAEACLKIAQKRDDVYRYTMKGNSVAVITDGSAVLGLGNIGSYAGLPVMEGKALLFKEFANIDAFPICLESQDVKKNIETIKNIAPVFGGINLEDFKAPECFEVENALQDLGIPVMHDDQHGTAIVVLAGMLNALKVVGKDIKTSKMVVSGAGAAAVAVTKLLIAAGMKGENVIMCDRKGAVYDGREGLDNSKSEMAKLTNGMKKKGSLVEVLIGADIFIGLSSAKLVNGDMIKSMNNNAIVFAMANPEPEIMPQDALDAGAAVVATGRSDFPNQVNNVLAFPGVFRGALDIRATRITLKMKLAAARALASIVKNPTANEIIPSPLDKSVVPILAEAVKNAWLSEKR